MVRRSKEYAASLLSGQVPQPVAPVQTRNLLNALEDSVRSLRSPRSQRSPRRSHYEARQAARTRAATRATQRQRSARSRRIQTRRKKATTRTDFQPIRLTSTDAAEVIPPELFAPLEKKEQQILQDLLFGDFVSTATNDQETVVLTPAKQIVNRLIDPKKELVETKAAATKAALVSIGSKKAAAPGAPNSPPPSPGTAVLNYNDSFSIGVRSPTSYNGGPGDPNNDPSGSFLAFDPDDIGNTDIFIDFDRLVGDAYYALVTYTNRLLDYIENHGGRASYFMVREYAELLLRYLQRCTNPSEATYAAIQVLEQLLAGGKSRAKDLLKTSIRSLLSIVSETSQMSHAMGMALSGVLAKLLRLANVPTRNALQAGLQMGYRLLLKLSGSVESVGNLVSYRARLAANRLAEIPENTIRLLTDRIQRLREFVNRADTAVGNYGAAEMERAREMLDELTACYVEALRTGSVYCYERSVVLLREIPKLLLWICRQAARAGIAGGIKQIGSAVAGFLRGGYGLLVDLRTFLLGSMEEIVSEAIEQQPVGQAVPHQPSLAVFARARYSPGAGITHEEWAQGRALFLERSRLMWEEQMRQDQAERIQEEQGFQHQLEEFLESAEIPVPNVAPPPMTFGPRRRRGSPVVQEAIQALAGEIRQPSASVRRSYQQDIQHMLETVQDEFGAAVGTVAQTLRVAAPPVMNYVGERGQQIAATLADYYRSLRLTVRSYAEVMAERAAVAAAAAANLTAAAAAAAATTGMNAAVAATQRAAQFVSKATTRRRAKSSPKKAPAAQPSSPKKAPAAQPSPPAKAPAAPAAKAKTTQRVRMRARNQGNMATLIEGARMQNTRYAGMGQAAARELFRQLNPQQYGLFRGNIYRDLRTGAWAPDTQERHEEQVATQETAYIRQQDAPVIRFLIENIMRDQNLTAVRARQELQRQAPGLRGLFAGDIFRPQPSAGG